MYFKATRQVKERKKTGLVDTVGRGVGTGEPERAVL